MNKFRLYSGLTSLAFEIMPKVMIYLQDGKIDESEMRDIGEHFLIGLASLVGPDKAAAPSSSLSHSLTGGEGGDS
jgi:hypothetical protein